MHWYARRLSAVLLVLITAIRNNKNNINNFKDSAHFCYCANVLCISGFLWVMPTNTGYLARFKTMRRTQNLASGLGIPNKNWG